MNALSRQAKDTMMCILFDESEVMSILSEFRLRLVKRTDRVTLFMIQAEPELITRIFQSQQGNLNKEILECRNFWLELIEIKQMFGLSGNRMS